jgi:hypothetical protein
MSRRQQTQGNRIVASDELHQKYAPVMHFARGERFFPMSVDDFLTYTALYVKGQHTPVIPRSRVVLDDLTHRYSSRETFLRSVAGGPIRGAEIVSEWGVGAIHLIYEWSQRPAVAWTEELARSAYDWFSEKTRAATRLFWWNSLLLPKAHADKKGGIQEKLPRFQLPQEVRRSAIESYEASQGKDRNYTYYYRTVQQAGYLGHHSRITKPWTHHDVEKVGTHPVIYVSAGAHASYPEAKQYPLVALYNLIDYATGKSFTLDHDGWRGRINLGKVPWLSAYLGSWGTRYWLPLEWAQKTLGLLVLSIPGEVDLPGVSAPRGPKFSDEGGERETWCNPVAFAGIP